MLGLCCCVQTLSICGQLGLFSSCSEWGLFSSWGTQAIEHMGTSSCGTWAYLPHGMWNLPRPGIELVSPALAGWLLTTGPPGKSCLFFRCWIVWTVYVLDMSPLLVILFANIFFHSVCCLFILFMVFFAVQNLLSFIRSLLSIFHFCSSRRQTKKDFSGVFFRVFCLWFLLVVL